MTLQSIVLQIYLYEDQQNKWSLEDAMKNPELLVKSKDEVPNFGVTKSTVWIKKMNLGTLIEAR